jgi:putative NADH-flavin reductase
MKIALFGATGATGIEFINQSENFGYNITAFVRSPEKLEEKFPKLKIVKASIDDYDILKKSVVDFDVVISLVGIAGIMQARKPNALYERTAKMLTKITSENNINRLIVVTSGGVVEAQNEPWFFKYLLKPIFLNKMYDDMRVMENIITNSNLNYTIVRPPFLTKGKLTKNYRVILDKWFDDDKDLSRADLAHYLLNCLHDNNIFKRIVGLSY